MNEFFYQRISNKVLNQLVLTLKEVEPNICTSFLLENSNRFCKKLSKIYNQE